MNKNGINSRHKVRLKNSKYKKSGAIYINYTVAAPDTVSVTYRINSSTSMLYDAYGSITLPNQQHYNKVIRVKVTQSMEASLPGVFKYIINTKMVPIIITQKISGYH